MASLQDLARQELQVGLAWGMSMVRSTWPCPTIKHQGCLKTSSADVQQLTGF